MEQMKVFIEMAPAKTKKVCSNCIHWQLWGVATGVCKLTGKYKTNGNYCRKIVMIQS